MGFVLCSHIFDSLFVLFDLVDALPLATLEILELLLEVFRSFFLVIRASEHTSRLKGDALTHEILVGSMLLPQSTSFSGHFFLLVVSQLLSAISLECQLPTSQVG